VPGPVIRVKQNEEVKVRFKNSIEQDSTIHWHGIRIDNKMDGVAGLTQEPIAPGESFDYRFTVPDAGTYWYHPHNRTWEQVARGLYGLLIVDEPAPPQVDHDIALAIDDWQLKGDGQLEVESFNQIGERAHGGRIGNMLTVNGHSDFRMDVKSGDRIRVRLCCTTNSRILNLRVRGGIAHLVAIDGQPVQPRSLKEGRLTLAPSQRADILLDMDAPPGAQAVISEISDVRVPLVRFISHASERSRPEILSRVEKLSDNPLLTPDRNDPLKVELDMTGGAMGGMRNAIYRGQKMSIDELVNGPGMIWAFNGVAGMPDKPLFTAKKGQTVEIDIINNTAFPHAMHMHGHHMSELRRVRETRRGIEMLRSRPDWRDTVLLDRAEAVKVGFVADNPGKWMIHCHMLEHQAGGMMTWFEVV
jgi:FtsP/CotA-like multicopper oxidase with cupredoxin domain